jgi:hypothetical protein
MALLAHHHLVAMHHRRVLEHSEDYLQQVLGTTKRRERGTGTANGIGNVIVIGIVIENGTVI